MNNLRKIVLFAQVICLCFSNYSVTQAANSLKLAKIINGMTLVNLDGPYQYDSGGVPLYGYIIALNIPIDPKDNNSIGMMAYQKTDKVQFHICKTGKEISVNYGDLVPAKQGCGTSGRTWPETTASWPEWKINSGKLVVDQKGNLPQIVEQNLKDILISDLPNSYQSTLLSERRGKTVAVTVKADDGSLLLGILPKRMTGSGS